MEQHNDSSSLKTTHTHTHTHTHITHTPHSHTRTHTRIQVIKSKGLEQISVEDLVSEITPRGRICVGVYVRETTVGEEGETTDTDTRTYTRT